MELLSSLKDTILIEVASVTRVNLPSALAAVRGCWKSSSLLWMQANDFPVLPGLILGGWSEKSKEAVARFCQEGNFSELLVRIEKPGQRWIRRRGGYTVPLKGVRNLVETLADEGMIAILLEPASPYADLFSLTSVCEVDTGKVDVEVVGPGFDASDILRADITPHERFELSADSPTPPWDRRKFQVSRTYVVDRENYRASVRRRLVKIGARLRNPSFPDELIAPSAAPSTLESLAQDAARYLRNSGQTALLDHSDHYEPMPPRLLDLFLSEFLRLFQTIAASNVSWRTFSLASSFLPENRLVIWDFFPPGDHDTRTLSNLRASPTAG